MSDETTGEKGLSPASKSGIILATLGIVFGDIGTSPLYALRECFSGPHGVAISQNSVLGAVSLILWFLVIIVSVKYVIFVMRADNSGEGGILALMALVHRIGPKPIRNYAIISLCGILGAALLFSDGVITPAISVLSAIEGLHVATPTLSHLVVPLSLIVLIGLFMMQAQGSFKIGSWFGPIIMVWFITIGILGTVAVAGNPMILKAVNPIYAIQLLSTTGFKGFGLLGTAFLAVTGAEVLYADMGHFGKSPIRKAWFRIVFPALILNYMGQGAMLLKHGAQPSNLFYQLAPTWFLIPLVIIATLATIVASQAVISGAFSLARQAVQLGFWPRIKVIHTSERNIGQVYLPFINLSLFVVTMILVLSFKESGNLASAYGIAVSVTMLLTTILVLIVSRTLWRVSLWLLVPVGILFVLLDCALVGANIVKIFSGGWVVALIALFISILMTTWVAGRKILQKRVFADALPLEQFVESISKGNLIRVPMTAVFLSGNPVSVPRTLLHNYKHNGILHAQTIIISIINEETPFVARDERLTVTSLGQGIYKVIFRIGFMESPDVQKVMATVHDIPGHPKDPFELSYFLGKESLVIASNRALPLWRKRLFLFLARNALNASSFFNLPPNRVIELGVQIEF